MGKESRPERRDWDLEKLATRQFGVVSSTQLRRLGFSDRRVFDAVAAGRLVRLHRGVFAVGHRNGDWRAYCLAAVLAAAPAFASHASAARLWGLIEFAPETIDVTATTRRRRRSAYRIHHAALAAADRDRCEEIPVTSPARTLLDLAATFSSERLDRSLEKAEELALFDLNEVEEVLGRVAHHRGAAPLRSALRAYRPDPSFTRSQLERRFLVAVVDAGLPSPSMNFNVAGLEVDAYWAPERLAVELDTFATHGTRAAFERDRVRDEELRLRGIEVFRITATRLDHERDLVLERIAMLLDRRRRQLGLRPRGGGAR